MTTTEARQEIRHAQQRLNRTLIYGLLLLAAIALLAAISVAPAPAQKIAGTGDVGPLGAAVGRNFPINWLYVPVDPSGNLRVSGLGSGGGGGGSTTIETNGVSNISQTVLNFQNTATVVFTNPSTGNEQATVPTATTSALGVATVDNISLTASAGAFSLKSTGANTIAGFGNSGSYIGYTAGAGISFAGGQISSTITQGPTLQQNSTPFSNQNLLNFTNTASVIFTNPSGGVLNATVPLAIVGTPGIGSPDNVSLAISGGGVYSLKSPGVTTVAGFDGSGNYIGYTAGSGISFAGGQISTTGSSGITGTLTTNCVPVATGTGTVGCSTITDNSTTVAISAPGGVQLTASTPSKISLPAGTGSIPALPANSAGWMAPASCGTCTAYLISMPGVIASGIPVFGTPSTVNNVNVSLMTEQHMEFAFGASANYSFFSGPLVISQAVALNPGKIVSLAVTNTSGGSCSAGPVFNIFDGTSSVGTAVTGSTTQQSKGQATTNTTENFSVAAGDLYGIVMTSGGTGCSGVVWSVYAVMQEPQT